MLNGKIINNYAGYHFCDLFETIKLVGIYVKVLEKVFQKGKIILREYYGSLVW